MMDFPVYSIRIAGFNLYAYGLALAFGCLVLLLALRVGAARHGQGPGSAALMLLLGGPLGLLKARLLFSLVAYKRLFFDAMEGSWLGLWPLFALRDGGFSLFGLLLGWLLAALLYARLRRQTVDRVMDWLAIPSALFVAIARFAEILGGQGYGEEMAEGLQFFPLAVRNSYEEWYLAVFVLEGLVALATALWLWQRGRRKPAGQPGNSMLRMLMPVVTLQIFLESLRQDAYLRLESNAFIRLGQLFALVLLLFLLVVLSRRAVRLGKPGLAGPVWLSLLLAAGCALAAEFNEKLPPARELLYALSLASLCLLTVLGNALVTRLEAIQQHGPTWVGDRRDL